MGSTGQIISFLLGRYDFKSNKLQMTNILLAAVWLLMCKNGVQKVGTEVEKAMFATQLEAN